jgi:hypothetical protein
LREKGEACGTGQDLWRALAKFVGALAMSVIVHAPSWSQFHSLIGATFLRVRYTD